jgi:hypothetical protein
MSEYWWWDDDRQAWVNGLRPMEPPKEVKDQSSSVHHPKHYTSHPSGIECIQITRHMGFNLGNAIKYIWRADLKGNLVEDLKKAVWYIQDEIARRTKA